MSVKKKCIYIIYDIFIKLNICTAMKTNMLILYEATK